MSDWSAEEIQEAHEYWGEERMPDPYQEPRRYQWLVQWYHRMIKPAEDEEE